MSGMSLLGLIIGIGAIAIGHVWEGGHIGFLIQAPAAFIVFGGCLGATLLQSSWHDMKQAFIALGWVVQPPTNNLQEGLKKITSWSKKARAEGFLSLERLIRQEKDPFLKKGLQLLADGNNTNHLRHTLEVDLYICEERGLRSAKFFQSMGGYAPTLGIIGAVLGLIHVMQDLATPENIGPGIATAFIATLYGVGVANLILLPIASRIEGIVNEQLHFREMMVEGMSAIASGDNPKVIEFRLQGFLRPK